MKLIKVLCNQNKFVEIDEQIMSRRIYKLSDADNYYEINISTSKLDVDFVNQAVEIKKN